MSGKQFDILIQDESVFSVREGKCEGRREGREEGLILSGKIFRVVSECPDLTNERIAEEVGCSVEEVEYLPLYYGNLNYI